MALWATVPFPRNTAEFGLQRKAVQQKEVKLVSYFGSDYLEITGEANLTGRWTSWVPAGTDVLALLGFRAKGSCIHLNCSGNLSCSQGDRRRMPIQKQRQALGQWEQLG